MSNLIEKEAPCSHCQYPNKVEVWSIINVKEDPELRDILIGGELNMCECVSCKTIYHVENFLIYHDPDSELLAFVYPVKFKEEKEKCLAQMKLDFETLQEKTEPEKRLTYEPMVLFGLDALLNVVLADEESKIQSEIVAILSKDAGLKTKSLTPFHAREHGLPLVVPYVNGKKGPDRQSFIEALQKIETLNNRLHIFKELKETITKNPAWAFPDE